MEHFKLKYMPFPEDMRGKTFGATIEKNGKYVILIDSCNSEQEQLKTLKHELAHILLQHFKRPESEAQQCEAEAISYADSMTDEEFARLKAFQIN